MNCVDRDDLVHLEEICRLAAGELDRIPEITQPVDQKTAERLIRRKWLADLLRDYAALIRGHLAGRTTVPRDGNQH
jgi:hypothetical protein